jgi:hypothetical protein
MRCQPFFGRDFVRLADRLFRAAVTFDDELPKDHEKLA